MRLFNQGWLLLAGLMVSQIGLAGPIYSFEVDLPAGSARAGDIKHISTAFNTNTNQFSWSHTISANNSGDFSDGFWLVVTDGENPKRDANEYAILYGDTTNNRLSVYEYSGQNNANSYRSPGNLLLSKENAFSFNLDNGLENIAFDLDVTDINNNAGMDSVERPSIWKGLSFGEKVGIWFHPSTRTNVAYDGDRITSFNYHRQGWYDTANRPTEVPEPLTLLLFAIGLLGLATTRRFSGKLIREI